MTRTSLALAAATVALALSAASPAEACGPYELTAEQRRALEVRRALATDLAHWMRDGAEVLDIREHEGTVQALVRYGGRTEHATVQVVTMAYREGRLTVTDFTYPVPAEAVDLLRFRDPPDGGRAR